VVVAVKTPAPRRCSISSPTARVANGSKTDREAEKPEVPDE